MIQINNLHKSFGKLDVLRGLELTIDSGKTVAILGPNGSGKTTMIKSILGLVIPQKGEILVNGNSVKNNWTYREEISYLPQIARFPENLKVKELIKMVQDLRKTLSDPEPLISLFGLEKFLDKSLRTLSGGTRQKVNVVLAFMFDSPIIIMDEPTVGLDPIAMIKLKKLIKEEQAKGKTILITTHIMSVVEELVEEIIYILEGKIYFRKSLAELNGTVKKIGLEGVIAEILEEV
ncbi:ABC transporter ATP-binding protein [Flexithrix dorotheae]|uniref:ABC transporter ATP-binding protein n=1 Tax=Flexithrix dorotheae TaxID=70993 RepID=UPI000365EA76|nr:ABC transporter ATP-binding protein [Flexithrix dorotheae]